MAEKKPLKTFQFCTESDYPVYIQCDLESFHPELPNLLKECHFTEVNSSKSNDLEKKLKSDRARVLSFKKLGQKL